MTARRFAALLLALALPVTAGCGVRLDEPDHTPAPASTTEEIRQREALRSEAYAGAGAGAGDSPAVAAIASHASAHLDALGGVWEPWPAGDGPVDDDGEPLHPSPTPDIGPFADAAAVLDSIAATTPELCAAAVDESDSTLATLLSSMCVSRTLDWDALATELGASGPEIPAVPIDLWTRDEALIRTLDAAAWATDRQAARAHADGSGDWQTLEAQADRYRELALDSVAANGWAGTEEDPRLTNYDPDALPDQVTIAAAIATAAAGAVPNSSDRQGVLDMAITYGVTARAGGVDLGPLPGLE